MLFYFSFSLVSLPTWQKFGEITGKTRVSYSELGKITGKTRVLPCGFYCECTLELESFETHSNIMLEMGFMLGIILDSKKVHLSPKEIHLSISIDILNVQKMEIIYRGKLFALFISL